MQNEILSVNNLSHRYTQVWAIRDINIHINKPGIVGLLGSNGAGKSTTMNILCGVLNQTEGEVFVGGTDMRKDPERAKQLLGFLPQNPPLYLDLTVDEYLKHCAYLRLMDSKIIKGAVTEAKERCGITKFGNRLIKNLSGGYRQRVGIAQAIIHHPKLVVLDEPTNGLDPNQIIEVRSLVKEIAADRTVILSSHILSEIQLLCHDIIMIEEGKIVFSDSMEAFDNYVEPHSLMLQLNNPPVAEELLTIEGVEKVEFLTERRIRIFFNGSAEVMDRIVELSVRQGWQLREIALEKSSIDEVFAQLSKKNR